MQQYDSSPVELKSIFSKSKCKNIEKPSKFPYGAKCFHLYFTLTYKACALCDVTTSNVAW